MEGHTLKSSLSLSRLPYRIDYAHPQAVTRFTDHLHAAVQQLSPGREIVCVCIGTDRSTGDALGPLVGSKLERLNPKGLTVFGTLDHPVHAVNLRETLQLIELNYQDTTVIGIDACLGQLGSVGSLHLGLGPLKPGTGVNKKLPEVGQLHITGIVNVGGFMEYFVLQNTRLSTVMKMADTIASSLYLTAVRLRSND
ncbi:spore protease YyaC [Novibacillus thermophilus]|jgi:putative sporulation protein YyaC|uniref:Spore protease YyaC n=1 Tax=Novibacillus thermophilus TaxID=1471761 RepID=A0A1U9KB77_9BACL|nr:spore protease YyaC [Novibacillus thermophilus]AQS57290.1 spore protease YyaC [Novibacillus thermophilus]